MKVSFAISLAEILAVLVTIFPSLRETPLVIAVTAIFSIITPQIEFAPEHRHRPEYHYPSVFRSWR